MINTENLVVVETASFQWPSDLQVPSKYFRLFVAANATNVPTEQISRFVEESHRKGMVYFCTWGPDCERVHDIADEVLADQKIFGPLLFTPITHNDTVMTTWHDDDTLEDALESFVSNSCPTESYVKESDMWLVFSVANSAWTSSIREQIRKLMKSSQEPH